MMCFDVLGYPDTLPRDMFPSVIVIFICNEVQFIFVQLQ